MAHALDNTSSGSESQYAWAMPVAALVAREDVQLRQSDKENRWACKDGIWILRTTRQWLPRDLDVLKPLFERMRTEGADFLQKNAAMAEEVAHLERRRAAIDDDRFAVLAQFNRRLGDGSLGGDVDAATGFEGPCRLTGRLCLATLHNISYRTL